MDDSQKRKSRLEIGHVLFIDIAGYSKLTTEEESEALPELNRIVRDTDAVREAEAAQQLIFLPTGDGMALVCTGSIRYGVVAGLLGVATGSAFSGNSKPTLPSSSFR